MQVWNVLHAACWKCRIQKIRYLCTIAQLCWAVSSQLRHVSTIRKKLVKQQYLLHMFSQYGERWPTNGWGTQAHFNGFRVLAALLHGTVVIGVSETLRCWTEGATYIRQGGHHVGHWPIFLVSWCMLMFSCLPDSCVILMYPTIIYLIYVLYCQCLAVVLFWIFFWVVHAVTSLQLI